MYKKKEPKKKKIVPKIYTKIKIYSNTHFTPNVFAERQKLFYNTWYEQRKWNTKRKIGKNAPK